MASSEIVEYFAAERQGGFWLVALQFDVFAQQRALVYTQWLQGLSVTQ